MTVQSEVFIDVDVLDAYSDLFRRLPALSQKAYRRLALSIKKRAMAELLLEPGSPTYPYVWSLDPEADARARRYYFGVILKGKKRKGGRYKRTGALLKAWDVDINITDKGGIIEMVNPVPGAEYVQGTRQIYGHIRTGWPNADDVALKWGEIATNEAIDLWYTLTDPYAGVPY